MSTGKNFLWNLVLDRPPIASERAKLSTAIKRLTKCQFIQSLVVLNRKKVVGIVTHRDLLKAIAHYKDWQQIPLSKVMSHPVVTVTQSDLANVDALLATFEQHQVSHLPVVNQQQQLIGLIQQQRLLKVLHQHRVETPFLEEYRRAQVFADITLKIRRSLQLKEILNTTVAEVQQLLKADRVLIYRVWPDGTGKTIGEAVASSYPALLEIPFPEEVFPKEYQQRYAQGRVQAIADVKAPESGLSPCLIDFVEQWNVRAKLIVPIVHPIKSTVAEDAPTLSNQLWGLLIAHQCSGPREWTPFELDLMQQLAGQISLALSQGQLLEYLEERVKLRTAELTAANRNLQQEIKERRQVTAALRRSEEQLRLITNNLPVLIAYVDYQQRYRFNNQAYEQWLGHSPEKIVGLKMAEVIVPGRYRKIQQYIETALQGKQVTYESELILKDGRERSVSVTYIPHVAAPTSTDGQIADDASTKLEAGKVKGFFALTADISDRKAIERMKDEFIAVVSHELRTPLTSIHSSLKLLATGRLGHLSEDGQQMLEVADENTDRLVRLVNNVLDLQRIEAGEVNIDNQPCEVTVLLSQAAEAMRSLAQQHQIEIKSHADPIKIWADPDYIVQTLTNLISNAVKFSSAGTQIHLRATPYKTASSTTAALPMALFSVKDSGQGIPANKLDSIFERFKQIDSSDSRKKGGTGLGLTICRKIVEQHGGQIWADSQLGEGSCFYFTVPLCQ